jgi:hypothetical protein
MAGALRSLFVPDCLRNARYLEAMAMLWIDLAIKGGCGPTFGFRTLERTAT